MELVLRQGRASYGAVRALSDVNLEIKPGITTAIIGPNGAGKSTLLNVLAGVHPLQGGELIIDGLLQPRSRRSAVIREGMGYSPEGRRVFPSMTVSENLQLGGHLSNSHQVRARMQAICDRLPLLRDRLDQNAGTLSGGQQQMLAIGRAMMREPRALLLDEPTLGLSPRMVAEIASLIQGLGREGMTIVLVEQNAHVALSLSEESYVLESGGVVISGHSRELRDDARIREAYLPTVAK